MATVDRDLFIALINSSNSAEGVERYQDYLARANSTFAYRRAAESFRGGPLAVPPLPSEVSRAPF